MDGINYIGPSPRDEPYYAPLSPTIRSYPKYPLVSKYQLEAVEPGESPYSYFNSIGGSDSSSASQTYWNTANITALQDKINGARLTIVCNGDGTITGTITWGTSSLSGG